jgi:hypothetical protein
VHNRLSDPESFFLEGTALSEQAQLGITRGEVSTGEHSRQENLTKALVALRPVEERHGLPQEVYCPTIVALGVVGLAEALVRQRVQDDISTGCGERQGALGGGDSLGIRAYEAEMDGQKV